MNRYNLDVELSKSQRDDFHRLRALDYKSSDWGILGRRAEEYWNIRDKSIPVSLVVKMIEAAYHIKDFDPAFVPTCAFITEDIDMATEMIRVLQMDFVHDFKSGLFFFDMFAHHEILMGSLYQEVFPKENHLYFTDAADKYVEKGMGCFNSSVNPVLWIGENVAIPSYLSQFKTKFERM